MPWYGTYQLLRRVLHSAIVGATIAPWVATLLSSGDWATAAPRLAAEPIQAGDSDAQSYEIINRVFALSPYGPRGDELRNTVMQTLIQRCMTSQGFDYVFMPYPPDPPVEENAPALVPPLPTHGEIDAEGYRAFAARQVVDPSAQPTLHQFEAAQAANEELAAADPGWTDALFGPEDGSESGCGAKASAAIRQRVGTRSVDAYRAIAPEVTGLLDPLSLSEPELDEATSAWASCMNRAGQSDYANPREIENHYYRDYGTEPSAPEITAAHIDLDCRVESSYRSIYLSTMADSIARWFSSNEAAVSELQRLTAEDVDALTQMAAEVLREGDS